jgi:hypothetical protein
MFHRVVDEILFKDLLQRKYAQLVRRQLQFFPVTSLNKYLYKGKSEIKVNINNSSENFLKKTALLLSVS